MTQNGKLLKAINYKLLKQYIYEAAGTKNMALLDAEVIPLFISVLEHEDYWGITSIACGLSKTMLSPEKEAEINTRYASQIAKCHERYCLRNGCDPEPGHKPKFEDIIWECACYIHRTIYAEYF